MRSRKRRVACIAGARPNFMKIAPIMRALNRSQELEGVVVHTGQHYDANMSDIFFEELGIPRPEFNLNVGGGPHGVQTGQIMVAFDEAFEELSPDLVLVVGDVNSTIACALVATKRHVPVAHVEAGLRSFDRSMPEEINRILTDQISDLLFTTEESAARNLEREGVCEKRIHFTGNTMIDTLARMLPEIERTDAPRSLGLSVPYGVTTFHRPSNVDREEILRALVNWMIEESERVHLVFPVHPRTKSRLESAGLWPTLRRLPGVTLLEPLPYTRFLGLVRGSRFVVTDSGGIQEETTWLGVPCLTQRTTTERPVTVDLGSNVLLGEDFRATHRTISAILTGEFEHGKRPPLWDGHCAERIVAVLERQLAERN